MKQKQLDHLAEMIYSECYGHLDDKWHRAEKTDEIRDWLAEGETTGLTDKPSDAVRLAAEWREYCAEAGDPNLK